MRAPEPKPEHRVVASAETVSDTLPHGFETGESSPRFVDVARAKGERFGPTARYEARRTLGEGGMGEVRLCAGAFVGREVAMKVIRASHGHADDDRHAQRALDLMAVDGEPELREERRAEAMREVGAALAVHPTHPVAFSRCSCRSSSVGLA